MKILRDFHNALLEPVCTNFNITTARYTYTEAYAHDSLIFPMPNVCERMSSACTNAVICANISEFWSNACFSYFSHFTASKSSLVLTRNSFGTLGVFVLFRTLRILIMDHKSHILARYMDACALRCSRIHCTYINIYIHIVWSCYTGRWLPHSLFCYDSIRATYSLFKR